MANYPNQNDITEYLSANPSAFSEAFENLSDYDKVKTLVTVYLDNGMSPKTMTALGNLAATIPGARFDQANNIVRDATPEELTSRVRSSVGSKIYSDRVEADKENGEES